MGKKKEQRVISSHGRNADLEFGEVPDGWTSDGWAVELQRKADRCEAVNPGLATYYRRWADVIARDKGGVKRFHSGTKKTKRKKSGSRCVTGFRPRDRAMSATK